MNQHHQRAIASASILSVLGIIGLIKLGYLQWGELTVMLLGAAFLYRSTYVRSRNAEKYGLPPSSSIFLRGVDGRDRF
jgi:hypothetical protein